MAAQYALSWTRSAEWAERLDKPAGRAISPYRSSHYDSVASVATHINSLDKRLDCTVEIYR